MDKKQSILIVDDSPDIIHILNNILKGYKIYVAKNGKNALKIAYEQQPDLILLDIVMPEMDGYEVLKKLKENESTVHIPVVFVSGLSEEDDEARGLELGALDFITKPFKSNLIKARVHNHLELKRHQDELEEIIETRTRETVLRLVLAAEARDTDTGQHIKRIINYTTLILKKTGLPEKKAEMIGLASAMHDIGKIGIPDDILLKPGRLTEEEMTIMQTHTEIGEKNLRDSTSKLLENGRLIAQTHHERWDGAGYPQGLKGEEIPLFGRVVCLVDVFDALISKRPYKEGLPLEKVLEIIKQGKGTHFDPELTEIFIESIDEILEIQKQYSETT